MAEVRRDAGRATRWWSATYIPEPSKADPDRFSKPFTFGLALEELGADKVMRHVGIEPSGDAFNSIERQIAHLPTCHVSWLSQ